MTEAEKNKIIKEQGKQLKSIRSACSVEFRALGDGEEEKMIIEGYALKFNNQTLIGSEEYGFREVIPTGALDETDMRKVPMKYNHSNSYLALASTKNDSLKLEVDSVGLRFTAELIPTSSNEDIYRAVKDGLLDEMSFGFTIAEQEWDWEQSPPIRSLTKIDRLFDVSLVDIPAYQNTEAFARSDGALEEARSTVEAEKRKDVNLRCKIELELTKINLGGNK